MSFRLSTGWEPVWWEPVIWPRANFVFSAKLTGLQQGTVTGGDLYLDGHHWPVDLRSNTLHVSVPAQELQGIVHGGGASMYLHTTSGPVLWLHGKVFRGGKNR